MGKYVCEHRTVSYIEGEWRCDNPSCRQEFVTAQEALAGWLDRG